MRNDIKHTTNTAFILGLLVIIILIAAFLRVHQIAAESFWLDEVIMVVVTELDYADILEQWTERGRPLLMTTVSSLWLDIFETNEFTVRILMAFFGILTVPVVYLIGKRLFGTPVGLMSALFMALSAGHIYHSQNYRYYSLVLLMTVLTFYFLIRALEEKKTRDFLLMSLCGIGIFYSHTLGGIVLIGWGIYFLVNWRRYKDIRLKWFLSQVFILIGILPVLYIMFFQGSGSELDAAEALGAVVPSPQFVIRSMLNIIYFQWHFFGFDARLIAVIALGLALIFNILRQRPFNWLKATLEVPDDLGKLFKEKGHYILLTILWASTSVLIIVFLSYTYQPFFVQRYLVNVLPAFLILIALVIFHLKKIVPQFMLLVVVSFSLLYSTIEYYDAAINEQWREAASLVEAELEIGDRIVMGPSWLIESDNPFDYYFPLEWGQCYIDLKDRDNLDLLQQLDSCNINQGRVWVILPDWMSGFSVERLSDFGEFLGERNGLDTALTQRYSYHRVEIFLFEL